MSFRVCALFLCSSPSPTPPSRATAHTGAVWLLPKTSHASSAGLHALTGVCFYVTQRHHTGGPAAPVRNKVGLAAYLPMSWS